MRYDANISQATGDFAPFSKRELGLIEHATALIAKYDPAIYQCVSESAERLTRLGQLLADFPSLRDNRNHHQCTLHGVEPLIDILCQLEPLELKLCLPAKAILAESYWMLKSHFFKDLLQGLASIPGTSFPAELYSYLVYEVSQLIHTHLLAQLLIDVILNRSVAHAIKQSAASYLLNLWDQCLSDDALSHFFRMIRSLWDARIKVQVQYGTLMGTSELAQLLEAQCDPLVLEFFMQPDAPEQEAAAFREFLFGLSHEEIEQLHNEMHERGLHAIDREQVSQMLYATSGAASSLDSLMVSDPHFIYRSYKRRRMQARHRAHTNTKGPLHTIEEYLLLNILRNHNNQKL